ncbi:MAG: kelch repeat-containing protein [Rhodanobacteraceae bacterium]
MRTIRSVFAVIPGLFAASLAMATGAAPAVSSVGVWRIGSMSVERAAHQATLLNDGRVLVTGGCSGRNCRTFLRSTESFDPSARTFRSAAPMSIPRGSHTATRLHDGRVLVAGGCTAGGPTAAAEIYDAASDRWHRVGDMTMPRCSQVAVALRDGRVFVMGGGQGRLGNLATAEVFDPASSTFSPVGPMRHNHYLATRLADGRVLLTGGQGDDGEILRSAEIFDPATNSVRTTGDMVTARVKHAAALLADGRVLIVGGSDGHGYDGRFGSTELYDPRSGRFSAGPPLHSVRHKLRDAIVVLRSGPVVVAGGARNPEAYDPAHGVFVAAQGELSRPQMFATATRLRSDRVLVLGGYDEHTRASASAWIITVKYRR